MSGKSQSIKITDKAQLVDWLKQQEADAENWLIAVSYTHLTLPTITEV